MSAKPIDPDSPLERLRRGGYEVEVREQHLLVHQIPYVRSDRSIGHGVVVCTYVESAGVLQAPDNHQIWFVGEFPCFADGQPIKALTPLFNESNNRELFKDCWVQHQFSNKPEGCNAFADHYDKMVHYINLISDQAKAINPFADARTGKVIETLPEESVFRYPDTASVRYEISTISARLALKKLAIIGLGGTGSYVLDQVAKTPIEEIHLFDGDVFLQHNAFRAPGAATFDELREQMPKAEYFFRRYDPMRRGIVSHPYRIDSDNLAELQDFDFIFVCVDNGAVRALICNYLQERNIRFIDVGMGLEVVEDSQKIIGTCRMTLSTESNKDHFARYVPMAGDDADNLYQSNIQVADMNALNAMLAVIKWKQLFGFYSDDFKSHHQTFSISSSALTRDAMEISVPDEA